MPRHSGTRNGESQSHVEACADAAVVLADKYEPAEALSRWLHRLVEFVGAKRGLATALHSGDPAYAALPGYAMDRLGGALRKLLEAAIAVKAVRSDIDAEELFWTVATMCRGPYGEKPAYTDKMVDVLIDGLRFGAPSLELAHLKVAPCVAGRCLLGELRLEGVLELRNTPLHRDISPGGGIGYGALPNHLLAYARTSVVLCFTFLSVTARCFA